MRLDALVAATLGRDGRQVTGPGPGGDAAESEVKVRQVVGDLTAAEVTGITMHSEAVAAGTLFCCVAGRHFDGHDFAGAAVRDGAVALLCQRPLDVAVPQVVVDDVRLAAAPVAAALLGRPSESMTVVGVTGTNGKTTTAHLLVSIFRHAGQAAATIGTLSGARTTPESPALQRSLAALRAEGIQAVAMEVSSHALVQHRVDAIAFAAAVFTNLTQDHLDYHGTMEEYFEAKAMLFRPGRARIAVVNEDDPWGQRLLARIGAGLAPGEGNGEVRPFSIRELDHLTLTPQGSRFEWRGVAVRLRLGGRFNVANALAAATTAEALGIDRASIAAGLEAVESVRGRFEAVWAGQPFTVLVDYAHTPDGLAAALDAARELTEGRVIVVFGAGGDRDREKRPLMGAVATSRADLAVLTSDNPRSEDPGAIIEQVAAGANGRGELWVEVDRATAIEQALSAAQPGDVVLVAGKGHEAVQEVGGERRPFDDAAVTRGALGRLGWTEEGS